MSGPRPQRLTFRLQANINIPTYRGLFKQALVLFVSAYDQDVLAGGRESASILESVMMMSLYGVHTVSTYQC